ncbi:hypothetical protein QF028_002900 [Neobacillus sp. B4I6]
MVKLRMVIFYITAKHNAGAAELSEAHESKSCSSGISVRPRQLVSDCLRKDYYENCQYPEWLLALFMF